MTERRLYRSTTDRKISGVAGGVAEYFNLDPTLVRVAWVLSVVAAGAGFLLYVILWIVLPEGPDGVPLTRPRPAIAIAEERYARGEITAEELAEIRKTLSEQR
ncbi:MAG TPA: PspC domain-containing protein [Actinomycetota bacterium]|nr:PspC domain-containing protein [Actinomycetota bacterium]